MFQTEPQPYHLTIKDLNFSYEINQTIINIKDLEISPGQRVFLYGPSGSGKSTFLNLLCGISPTSQGQILYNDVEFHNLAPSDRDRFRAEHIGVIFQQFNLIPYLNILENIQLASYFSPYQFSETKQNIQHIFERLSLSDNLLKQRADTLSVGQQQRVAIARALINHPSIIIADEPTSALDSDSRDDFIKLLFECTDSLQSTIIFVSHDESLSKHFETKLHLNHINHA
tara:strand:+ start:5572 stop:6255 length:684 start_codon:yes stop_codon:yes gene_type:complete